MQDYKPLLKKFIGKAYILTTNVLFIDFTGSHEGGIFLQQLLYWQNIKGEGLEFAKSYDEWFVETRITKRVLGALKTKFEGMGLLQTKVKKFNGVPILHWLIDVDLTYNLLFAFVSDVTKCTIESDKMLLSESDKMLLSKVTKCNELINIDYNIDYNIKKEKSGKPKKAQPAQTKKASYVWQAEKNNAAGLEEIRQHCINEASKLLTEVYYKHTGKHIILEDARKWIEVCAIGKNFDIQKTTFNPDGSVSNCPLTQWLLNSAKKAIEEGRFTLPKSAVKANTNNQIL